MKRVFCRYFTLVELLTVIAVIGILAAIGFGTYSTAQNKSRISATRALVENVANAFEAARAEVGYMPVTQVGTTKHFRALTVDAGNDYLEIDVDGWSSSGKTKFQKAFAKNVDGELLQRFMEENKLKDSWGNQIYYCYPGIANNAKCSVISAGPDGTFGKDNDETPSSSTPGDPALPKYKSSGEWICDDIANF
ncbi:MAG: type II secretion system GspH family protein [Victivallaceae bacterium]|nr:type II secretion system GspH family protein [Victivallaceae bacterium]